MPGGSESEKEKEKKNKRWNKKSFELNCGNRQYGFIAEVVRSFTRDVHIANSLITGCPFT